MMTKMINQLAIVGLVEGVINYAECKCKTEYVIMMWNNFSLGMKLD